VPLALPLDYPVYVRAGVLDELPDIIAQVAPAHRYAVISDERVGPLYGKQLAAHLRRAHPDSATELFTIPAGEHEKTRARWSELTDALLAWGAGRDTTVVAVGGGVICDLAGFVAATYMRGVPVVQLPTTLLAMVDAAVGGKTAVDTSFGKNLIGAFHNPSAVIIDPSVLATLPAPELRSGLAEMLKHGIIADAAYFNDIVSALPNITALGAAAPEFATLIAGSVRIKANVVATDSHEHGLRHTLNFGHTIAHAIERVMAYQILHGDAVAIGMVVESRLAVKLGLADAGITDEIVAALELAQLPTTVPPSVGHDDIIDACRGDKKNRAGQLRFSLPLTIGKMEPAGGRWSVAASDTAVLAALAAN